METPASPDELNRKIEAATSEVEACMEAESASYGELRKAAEAAGGLSKCSDLVEKHMILVRETLASTDRLQALTGK